MKVIHDHSPEIKTKSSSEFDLSEYYQEIENKTAESLNTPELDGILKVAVDKKLLQPETYDELQQAEGEEYYQQLDAIFADLNPRDLRKGFVERNQLQEKLNPVLYSEDFQQATLQAAEAVEMTTPEKLSKGHYKLVVAHGGLNQTPKLRVEEALNSFITEEGGPTIGRSVEVVAALGGNRLLATKTVKDKDGKIIATEEIEKENVKNYTEHYTGELKNEADLMDAAVQNWLREHGLEDVIEGAETIEGTAHGPMVSGVPYSIRLYDLQAAKADGRLPETMPNAIIALDAPMDATRQVRRLWSAPNQEDIHDKSIEGLREIYKKYPKDIYKDRPDTEDPLDMVREVVGLEPGDLVGSISHHPVSKAQLLITQEAFLGDGAIVKEGAYKSDALIKNPAVRFSEICKFVAQTKKLRDLAREKRLALEPHQNPV